ncbi:MAG: PfkB family carbohydrate kinase [Chloroflexi bacterium]|nr:PfkB family carbohydrate kinase [Chloroflexota bacterium]MCY3696518.1 PfkB family carbohydrate kinase [Chloroflexota bacterium]
MIAADRTIDEPSDIDLAVVGAIALDEIHSQAGDIDQLLGGSAVYACLAASLLAACAPISIIGDDLDRGLLQPLRDRGVRFDSVVEADGANFRWGCQYSASGDIRETLYTRAGVYDSVPVVVAPLHRRARIALLTAGNPDQNRHAMAQLIEPELVAIDTIEREVAERRDEFRAQLRHADLVSINTLEAAHLIQWPGSLDDPALAEAAWTDIRSLGPSTFVLKKASQGVEVFQNDRRTQIGAVPDVVTIDPTGAGDSFAGGLLSSLAQGTDLIEAAVWGCAVASFAIERFGTEGLLRASPSLVSARAGAITVRELDGSTPIGETS